MRWIGFAIFITLLISVSGGVGYYLYRRVITLLAIDSGFLLWAVRIAFVVLTLSYPTARLMVRQHINILSVVWFWIGSIWMGFALYWFFINIIAHFFIFVVKRAGFQSFRTAAETPTAYPMVFVAVLVVTIAICAFGYYRARCRAHVTEIEVPIKKLPPELDGFKIVHITDYHLGIVVGEKDLERRAKHIASLDPDLLLITGDLVDEDPEELDCIFEGLRRLKAKHGVFAVTGNHEFYNKARRIIDKAAESGIKYLQNEKILVADRILLYGIDDPTLKYVGGRQVPFEDVIGPEAKKMPAILMYHQPSRFGKAASLGIDLMLSGHTHNAQLWPIGYVVRLFFPRVHGLYEMDGAYHYVSRGLGVWGPPMRVGAPPEIVEIKLTSNKK